MTPTPPPMPLRLAAERATGVLLRESGALYLWEGRAVHAESPASPGIGRLLTAGGTPAREDWRRSVEAAGAAGAVGRHLVDSGLMAAGAVEIGALVALFDAAYFVLDPAGGPWRFRPGARHWFGAPRPVPVAALERETARRRRFLRERWPDGSLDAAPVRRRARPPGGAPPGRRLAAVLALADGGRTPADIARALGRPAFHTLVDVRTLAAHGLLEAAAAAGAAEAGAPPVRGDGGLDVATLRRVRDALEARL